MNEIVSKLYSIAKTAADTALFLCGACVVIFSVVMGLAVVAPVIVADFCVALVCRICGLPYERNNIKIY
jgi:hypothetical protein